MAITIDDILSSTLLPSEGHPAPDDGTEVKNTADTVRDIELLMYRQVKAAVDAVIMLDDSGSVMFCNGAAELMLGRSAEEMYGADFHALFTPERFRAAAKQGFARFRQNGRGPLIGTTSEVVVLRQDGSEFTIELSISAIEFRGTWHALGLMKDITVRKQLEREIRDALEYAENIVETVREPLAVLNSELKILTVNDSFYKTFKVTAEETIGKYIYDLGNRQWDNSTLRVLLEEILPQETVFNGYEVEHDFPVIGRKTMRLNARQIFRENVASRIILLAIEDITERKRLERENRDAREYAEKNRRLAELSRAKYDFLANMSHELCTPLNAIVGFSGVLHDQQYGQLNEQQYEYISHILDSGKHLHTLINSILDFSKAESRMTTLELSSFSLLEALEAAVMMLTEKALKREVIVQLELARQDDIPVMADMMQLKQIMANLLSNAIKFSEAGGIVIISAAITEGTQITISVTDSGIGIKPEDVDGLFEIFTQLEPVHTKKYEGTGLGLALVKQLVELHGGRIWVESTFGSGSRFSFTIPQTQ